MIKNDETRTDDQDTDDTGDQDDGQEPELPDLDERIELFLYGRTGRKDHDDVRAALTDPEIIAGSEGYVSGLMTELDDRDHQLAEQAAEIEAKRLAADREARKAQLRSQLEQDRVTKAADSAQEALDAELLAEIQAEAAAAAGEPTTGPEDALYVTFEESLAVVRDPKATPDQKLEAANRGIEAARQLEIAAPGTAPVDLGNPDEWLREWNERKGK